MAADSIPIVLAINRIRRHVFDEDVPLDASLLLKVQIGNLIEARSADDGIVYLLGGEFICMDSWNQDDEISVSQRVLDLKRQGYDLIFSSVPLSLDGQNSFCQVYQRCSK